MVTPDNYYELDPRPTEETTLSGDEVHEYEALAKFAESSEMRLTTFKSARLVLKRHGHTA